MKTIVALCVLAIVLTTSCNSSIDDQIAHLEKIDLTRFKNESIYYRDASTIFISSINSGPYIVRLNYVSRRSVMEVSYKLVKDTKLRSEKELQDLADAFMELKVMRIDYGNSNGIYFALNDVEKLDLLRWYGNSPPYKDWTHIKEEWYSKKALANN